jgi:hypothetical protein
VTTDDEGDTTEEVEEDSTEVELPEGPETPPRARKEVSVPWAPLKARKVVIDLTEEVVIDLTEEVVIDLTEEL